MADAFTDTFGAGRGAGRSDTLISPTPGVSARAELQRLLDACSCADFHDAALALHAHGALLHERPLLGELLHRMVDAGAAVLSAQWAPAMRVLLDAVGLRGWQAEALLADGRRVCHIAPAARQTPLVVPACETLCGEWTSGRYASWQRVPRGAFAERSLGYEACPRCAQGAAAFPDAFERADYPPLGPEGMAALSLGARRQLRDYLEDALLPGELRAERPPCAAALTEGLLDAVRCAYLEAALAVCDFEHALVRALSDCGYEFLASELGAGTPARLSALVPGGHWHALLECLCPSSPAALDAQRLRGAAPGLFEGALRLLWKGRADGASITELEGPFAQLLAGAGT